MRYVACVFVADDSEAGTPGGMPGVERLSVNAAIEYVRELSDTGVSDVLLFGVPADRGLDRAAAPDAVIPRFLTRAREVFGDEVTLVADIGLSPYSSDGHSVVMTAAGSPDPAASYDAAGRLAVAFAAAGAHAVAPCLSLPDQVTQVRDALGNSPVPVIPYSTKFSSAFYGPYRQTVNSPLGAVRKSYQTDHTDIGTGLAQLHDDVAAGCDTVIVKPSMLYLDVLAQACATTDAAVWAYHVSGEYLALLMAAEHGGMSPQELFDEYHDAVRRCGAEAVIGYAPQYFTRGSA